jgi:hypothetical protein
VTRSHSPLDTALDLLVYVPVGFVLTAAEEIPKLAAKGRARVGGQVGMARVVGQFAVAQGRKEFGKRWSAAGQRDRDDRQYGPPDWPEPVDAEAGFDPGSDSWQDLGGEPGSEPPAHEGWGGPPDAAAAGATRTPAGGAEKAVITDAPPAGSAGLASSAGLAIPGYDSLAASQVVPRLAGLSPEELAAVGAYESAHRARRTILTRIRQLQER